MSEKPCDCPVIQMHLRQLHPIGVAVHMCSKPEPDAVVIPQVFLLDHAHNSALDCVVFQRPAIVIPIHKNVLCRSTDP